MTKLLVAALSSFLVFGCSDDDSDATDTDVQAAMDDGDAHGNALAPQTTDDLAEQASVIHTINDGEILQAMTVLDQTDDSEAVDFANMMIEMHTQSNAMIEAMMDDQQIEPADNAVSQTLRQEAAAGVAQLESDSDDDVARLYLHMQVMMHEEAYVIVSALQDNDTGDTDWSTLVDDTLDTIQTHREDAINRLQAVD
jgi:putative membrane protein